MAANTTASTLKPLGPEQYWYSIDRRRGLWRRMASVWHGLMKIELNRQIFFPGDALVFWILDEITGRLGWERAATSRQPSQLVPLIIMQCKLAFGLSLGSPYHLPIRQSRDRPDGNFKISVIITYF